MNEKSIPERVLDKFISSLEGSEHFDTKDLDRLRKLLEKDQVSKNGILSFIKMEAQE